MQLGIKQLFRYTKNVSCGEKEERKKQKEKKKKAGLLPIIRPVWWFGECRALAWDNAQELLRPVHQDVVWRQKATHAYSGSDSRYWPRHYLRQETRTRVMPLLPVVRSCRRRGDRQSPSTRDDRELFRADVVLNLTRPFRLLEIQPCIRQTL